MQVEKKAQTVGRLCIAAPTPGLCTHQPGETALRRVDYKGGLADTEESRLTGARLAAARFTCAGTLHRR